MLEKKERILPAWMRGADSADNVKAHSEKKKHEAAGPDTKIGTDSLNSKEEPLHDTATGPGTSTIQDQRYPIVDTISDEEDEAQADKAPTGCTEVSDDKKDRTNSHEEDGGNQSVNHTQPASAAGRDNSPTPSRESCLYGSSCYRKNPQHKVEFAHPGDTDYSPQSTSKDRPLCMYGAACYRKNPQHRKEFSHNVSKKRKARPTDMQDLPSEDEEPDFGGGSSDDYNPGDSESDESFITSDSLESGKSDYDPEDEDVNGDKKKKKNNKKNKLPRKIKKKQKKNND